MSVHHSSTAPVGFGSGPNAQSAPQPPPCTGIPTLHTAFIPWVVAQTHKFDFKNQASCNEISQCLQQSSGESQELECADKHELTTFEHGFVLAHNELPTEFNIVAKDGLEWQLRTDYSAKTLGAMSNKLSYRSYKVTAGDVQSAPLVMRVHQYHLKGTSSY
jgi:hypothetical protein